MGPEAAVNIIHRAAIEAAPDPAAVRAEFIADYRQRFANPYSAAALGFIDEVIQPRHVRKRLATALATLSTKRDRLPSKKHGNEPL